MPTVHFEIHYAFPAPGGIIGIRLWVLVACLRCCAFMVWVGLLVSTQSCLCCRIVLLVSHSLLIHWASAACGPTVTTRRETQNRFWLCSPRPWCIAGDTAKTTCSSEDSKVESEAIVLLHLLSALTSPFFLLSELVVSWQAFLDCQIALNSHSAAWPLAQAGRPSYQARRVRAKGDVQPAHPQSKNDHTPAN